MIKPKKNKPDRTHLTLWKGKNSFMVLVKKSQGEGAVNVDRKYNIKFNLTVVDCNDVVKIHWT
jgi:hypothetical protein